MGLFDNIRNDILDAFSEHIGCNKNTFYDTKYSGGGFEYLNESQRRVLNNRNTSDLVNALEMKRWGYYPICTFCQCDKCYALNDDKNYRCGNYECRRNFNVFNGTVLSNTKTEINKWYDLAKAYRDDKKFSTRSAAKTINVTQKTCWWMLEKLKTSQFINEPDVPILQILLTPITFTHKSYTSKRLSFKDWETKTIINLSAVYNKNSIELELLHTLIALMRTHFNCSQINLSEAIGIDKKNLCRYFSGARRLPAKQTNTINQFIQSKIIHSALYMNQN